jgi:hypothetical protein
MSRAKIYQHSNDQWYRQATVRRPNGDIVDNAFVPLLQGDTPDHYYLLLGRNNHPMSPNGAWSLCKRPATVLSSYDPGVIQWFCNQVELEMYETPESAAYANRVIDTARHMFADESYMQNYFGIYDIRQAYALLRTLAKTSEKLVFNVTESSKWETYIGKKKAENTYRYKVTLTDHEGVKTTCESWVHSMAIYGALAIYYLNTKG